MITPMTKLAIKIALLAGFYFASLWNSIPMATPSVMDAKKSTNVNVLVSAPAFNGTTTWMAMLANRYTMNIACHAGSGTLPSK